MTDTLICLYLKNEINWHFYCLNFHHTVQFLAFPTFHLLSYDKLRHFRCIENHLPYNGTSPSLKANSFNNGVGLPRTSVSVMTDSISAVHWTANQREVALILCIVKFHKSQCDEQSNASSLDCGEGSKIQSERSTQTFTLESITFDLRRLYKSSISNIDPNEYYLERCME